MGRKIRNEYNGILIRSFNCESGNKASNNKKGNKIYMGE